MGKGREFPYPDGHARPETTVFRLVSALKVGDSRNILRAVESAEISHKSDPGKHLAFERPVPAVQVGAAFGRQGVPGLGSSLTSAGSTVHKCSRRFGFQGQYENNIVVLGPRVSVPVGKFTPFAEALFGASRINASASGFSDSDTSFATALGGGIDYRLIHGIGLRMQADMLQTRFFSGTQNNFRLSTGIVLHF